MFLEKWNKADLCCYQVTLINIFYVDPFCVEIFEKIQMHFLMEHLSCYTNFSVASSKMAGTKQATVYYPDRRWLSSPTYTCTTMPQWVNWDALPHNEVTSNIPDSKVHGADMGPIWGRQDPGGPHVGPMSLVIWDISIHQTVSEYENNPLIKRWVVYHLAWRQSNRQCVSQHYSKRIRSF